jgi:TRAP-type mannitol/chloroaromatic compound transport system permease small subunit
MFKEKIAVLRLKYRHESYYYYSVMYFYVVLYTIMPSQHQRVSVLDTRWYRHTSVEVKILSMCIIWEQNGLLAINK